MLLKHLTPITQVSVPTLLTTGAKEHLHLRTYKKLKILKGTEAREEKIPVVLSGEQLQTLLFWHSEWVINFSTERAVRASRNVLITESIIKSYTLSKDYIQCDSQQQLIFNTELI